MEEKLELKEIDKENWRFVIYEDSKKEWIGDFTYSPQSFIDLSILIKLTKEEMEQFKKDREKLLKFADKVRFNYHQYFSRSLDRTKYEFTKS